MRISLTNLRYLTYFQIAFLFLLPFENSFICVCLEFMKIFVNVKDIFLKNIKRKMGKKIRL